MHVISIKTGKRQDLVDLTPSLRDYLRDNRCSSGMLLVYCPHTTAGISVNENADPSVKRDITVSLNKLVPADATYTHAEGNADAHIKSSLVGASQTFIVDNGRIQLGTWQGIFFMEFDGPRHREVWLEFLEKK